MALPRLTIPITAPVLLAWVAMIAAGCAGPEPPQPAASAGMRCVDDSPDCVGKRKAALGELVADAERKWMKEPASAEAFASGVRLFAYKTKKKEMSCDELTMARQEADAAPAALKGAKSLSPSQMARGALFAAEVGKELGKEFNRRCRKG